VRLLIELTALRILPAIAFGAIFYSLMGLVPVRRDRETFVSRRA
jgi:hypothetical protein